MIDAPPAHLDTVLTTLSYLERSMRSFGMQYVTVDLQLYQTTCLVQWNYHERWKNLILVLHPGMMHTLMSFLSCIGTLMKASGIEVLISVAFGSIISIDNGTAWPTTLHAYRLITAVLLAPESLL